MESLSKKILEGILKTKRVANGYIFSGGNNQAKIDAAIFFAKSLNCKNRPICNDCISCKKTDKNINPDIIFIERDKSNIKIDQIRQLKEMTKYGPSENKYQVLIIKEADTMTTEASNSFLKLLEEPKSNVVFILLCDKEGALPKTISSRCQKISFTEQTSPASEDALNLFKVLGKKPFDYIEASQALQSVKDVKPLLKEFFILFGEAKKPFEARTTLEIIRGLEKRASQKLAIDLFCLKLWKKNLQLN